MAIDSDEKLERIRAIINDEDREIEEETEEKQQQIDDNTRRKRNNE